MLRRMYCVFPCLLLLLVLAGLPRAAAQQPTDDELLEKATALNDLVVKHYQAGQYGQAIELAKQSLAIRK